MAARALWRGSVSVGLVNAPVKLYTAVRPKDVRFRELHATDGARLRHIRVCSKEDVEVPLEDVVKGYEVGAGRHVVITQEELDAAAPPSTRTITIDRFVPGDEIDQLAYDRTYHVGADRGGEATFALLAAALAETGRVGIGKVVMRSKEYLAALRPYDGGLVLSTMHFADEMVAASSFEELEAAASAELKEKELAIAEQLIESLSAEFEHERFEDSYREQVLELVRAKAEGREVESGPVPEPEATDDLLAALEASLADAKQRATAKPAAKKRTSRAKA
jgi:DNA end-binding protein Ku